MSATIFLITGFSDISVWGNQSMKNCIKYLSEFGYQIRVFTFLPKNYPNLQDPKNIFNSKVEFHRSPNILSYLLNFGRRVKDSIGRWKLNPKEKQEVKSSQTVEYYEEYNSVGRMFYIIFLFVLYLPVELLRTSFYYLKAKPDIFYGVNCQGAVVASLLGRIFDKPVITRFHGTSVREENLEKFKDRLLRLDEITGMKIHSDAIVMGNDGTKGDKILKLLNVNEAKIYYWMNGLDFDDLILPSDWNPENFRQRLGLRGHKTILMISRLAKWKRVDRGIHCISKLKMEYNLNDIVLLIIGDGPDRKRLEELTEELGVKDCVHFIGGVPHKEVAKFYSVADAFLSLYDISNLGNPLIEALHFGLPIVTIADGSTNDILRDGYNSLLVKIEDLEEELCRKTKNLLEDQSLRKKISENAVKTFKEKVLTWEERMKLEERLIRNILK